MSSIFVDTSAWFMLTSSATSRHADAAAVLRRLIAARERLVTTNLVVVELHRLTLIKANRHAARSAVSRVSSTPHVDVIHADGDDLRTGLDWITRFDDQDFTLTDATSFAIMERLGIRRAFAYDRDFAVAGFELIGA